MRRINRFLSLLVFLFLIFLHPSHSFATPNTTWVVNNPANSGSGTLREALQNVADGDTITFDAGVFPTANPVTITPLTELPYLSHNNVTLTAENAGVILEGGAAPGGANGISISGSGNSVRGFRIQNFSAHGVYLAPGAVGNTIGGDRTMGSGLYGQGNLIVFNDGNGVEIRGPGASGNFIEGNFIGVDPLGMYAWGNGLSGVAIWAGASGNTVGGNSAGLRNVISGNTQNGIWIQGAGTTANVVKGNFVGTRADGLVGLGNGFAGVSLQGGAANNIIGGTTAGARNIISGNQNNGIYLSDAATTGNQILGNYIGTNTGGTAVIGQGFFGVLFTQGASGNFVGNGTASGRNVISGNDYSGVCMQDANTQNNTVQGNYLGTNLDGTTALSNGLHGVLLQNGTHDNQIGGNRLAGQGNLMSGNLNHGLVLTTAAHDNTVQGNLIGPDAGGTYSLGHQPWGGIDVADDADNNTIGGLGTGEGNVISGNGLDGIAIYDSTSNNTDNTDILGNLIGLTADGGNALPNETDGIFNVSGARGTHIEGNTISGNGRNGIVLAGATSVNSAVLDNRIGTNLAGTNAVPNHTNGVDVLDNSIGNVIGPDNMIAYNQGYGVILETCAGTAITQNSIYENVAGGIGSPCLSFPVVRATSTTSLSGTAAPNAVIEIFSDNDGQGHIYEGTTTANGSGAFTFTKAGGFTYPNVTTTATTNNTSAFSQPVHTLWTVLIYMNADNNLEPPFWDAFQNLAASGPGPLANVLVLYDGSMTNTQTILYDLTSGTPVSIPTDLSATPGVTLTVPGELDMGDGHTLEGFVAWGRDYYPSEYTMLSILDHGGGWAPSTSDFITGTLRTGKIEWLGGVSGLSWDQTDGFDYLNSPEIKQTFAAISGNGTDPLDVVYFDACLMGMIETAYQIRNDANYFISSQNIGWAPTGANNRYTYLLQSLTPTTDPAEMAQLTVQAYAATMPPEEHPFTVSALDMSQLPQLAGELDQLASVLSQVIIAPNQAAFVHEIYTATQKLDYDGDFSIEPTTDGFVDLYDFALHLTQYPNPTVVNAANAVLTTLDQALLAEAHQSGSPWFAPTETWDLENTHGLSIFLPFGEDLDIPTIQITETIQISPTIVITRNLHLRELYSSSQLDFVQDTTWGTLIQTYYEAILQPPPPTPTIGPVAGLQTPDVTPPQTTLLLIGDFTLGTPITLHWDSLETQSGLESLTLLHRLPGQDWSTLATLFTVSGDYPFTLQQFCQNDFAIQGKDRAGNVEPLLLNQNLWFIKVQPCSEQFLPIIFR